MSFLSLLSRPIVPRIVVVGVIIVSVAVTIVGFANEESVFQKAVPESDDAIARHYIYLLRTGQVAPVLETIDKGASNEGAKSALDQAVNILQGQVNPRLSIKGWRWNLLPAGKRATLSYESSGDRSWVLILVSFMTMRNKVVLEAFRVQPLSESLEATNALTFKGKGFEHYAWMVATVTIGLFVLITLFLCAWAPYVQFRWLWMILIVVGIARLSMNWTTGESAFTPMSLALPPIAFNQAGPGMPWTVTFLLPIGAVLYWCLREKLTLRKQPAPDPGL